MPIYFYYVHQPDDEFTVYGDPKFISSGTPYFKKDILQLPVCNENEILKMTKDGDFYCRTFEPTESEQVQE